MRVRTHGAGFTLIEILLVVAAIAILAGIVIVAINPAKQLADTRNARRYSDVNAILNAVHQYAIDHDGDLPSDIDQDTDGDCPADDNNAESAICIDGSCSATLVNLYDDLVSTYIVDIPVDPSGATGENSNYHVVKDAGDRITVCAPEAERSVLIEVSR